jgi:hypothetical protein
MPDHHQAPPAPARREGRTGKPRRLGSYRTTAHGQRLILGHRILGVVRLVDAPAEGEAGQPWVIERELTSNDEVRAIVADYLAQAKRFDDIPIRHDPTGAAR